MIATITNQWAGQGSIPDDPKLYTGKTSVLKFTVCCTEYYITRHNEQKETSEWVRCVAFGEQAETLARDLHKDDVVSVTGKLSNSSYVNRDGQKVYKTEIHVRTVTVIGTRPTPNPAATRGPTAQPRNVGAKRAPTPDPGAYYGDAEPVDDIPF